ncbi:MAG: acyltransferase, partial [Prevotella sp.]|nr:acyltransferase [Prevotella sp.]
ILYIGRNTLPVYMFHPIFTMAGKYLLPIFQFDASGVLHAVAVIVMGIVGSLLIAKSLDRLHLSWIFGRAQLLR